MLYLFGGFTIGAIVLAVYERRKNLRMIEDDPTYPAPHDRERAAYTESERLAQQNNQAQMPGNF